MFKDRLRRIESSYIFGEWIERDPRTRGFIEMSFCVAVITFDGVVLMVLNLDELGLRKWELV